MKGKYDVIISNSKLSFTLTLERNITIIRGDSATGKTTFIEMLRNHEQYGKNSGVTVRCAKKCRVLENVDWEYRLSNIHDSIVFMDEGNEFVRTPEFARAVRDSDNYYVIITRESLYQLPYSVNSVLKLKKTGRKKKVYIRSYPNYEHLNDPITQLSQEDRIITEDSNAGHDMFAHIANGYGVTCDSANGKSNILNYVVQHPADRILVVADGAAFGAELDKLYQLMDTRGNKITLYLPESFEWLILKSRVLGAKTPVEIMDNPSIHIESSQFFSWEQFFTSLLITLTQGTVLQYSKARLNPAYLQPANISKIVEAMQE